jgi:uncharacterized protein (DUF362 family)
MKVRKNPSRPVKRRDFLKIMSLTGVGGFIASKSAVASILAPADASKVVVVTDTGATDKTAKTVNADVVRNMVDAGIKNYTGIDNVGEAWKSIFPGITQNSVIGLKVNTLFSTRNTGTHPQVAKAVTDGLVQMDFGGTPFPENNIIIFDYRNNFLATQGYTLNSSTTGVRCFPNSEYTTENYDIGGVNVKLTKIITETINYMVNIAYLKQHFLSGVSLCLKNHYGSIQNAEINYLLHDDSRHGSPYIAAISALEPVKLKQKFCIIDGLFGVTANGPSGVPTVIPDKIIMGQDIVAVDYTGRELLKTLGLASAQVSKTVHIDIAATTYSLGTNNPANINVVDINTSPTGIEDKAGIENHRETFRNAPNPFSAGTEISFFLKTAAQVQVSIYAYNGRQVTRLIRQHLGEGLHTIPWDGLDASGNDMPDGVYLCELKTGSESRSIIMQKFIP